MYVMTTMATLIYYPHMIDHFKDFPLFFVETIESPYIVFFNGFLAENRPSYSPTYKEIEETIYANYLTPLHLFDQCKHHLRKKY